MRKLRIFLLISLLLIGILLVNACAKQKPEEFIGKGTPVAQGEESKEDMVVREYTVISDDYGFYPNKIKAKVGEKVKINFKFRNDAIYYGGMDVKGPFPDVNYKLKGEQPITREFVMKEETKIISYWPATGKKKATLVVNVEE